MQREKLNFRKNTCSCDFVPSILDIVEDKGTSKSAFKEIHLVKNKIVDSFIDVKLNVFTQALEQKYIELILHTLKILNKIDARQRAKDKTAGRFSKLSGGHIEMDDNHIR